MLRSIPEDTLAQSGIGDAVEPMVWVYVEDVDRFVDPITWMTFSNVFRHIWVASAFKVPASRRDSGPFKWIKYLFLTFVCISLNALAEWWYVLLLLLPLPTLPPPPQPQGAFGERLYLTNIHRHVNNQLGWLEVMRRESRSNGGRVSFRGVALTGWSRYDHFAVLCELLPSSVPSLVLSLAVLAEGGHSMEAAK